jgi:Skp family chaperone for outer membrane proteins
MQQFKKLEAKKRQEILRNIQKAIASRAELEGYSLVLDHSGKTLNGISAVLFYKPHMDITEEIIKDLNRGHKTHK